jgi:cytoskeleton protein RodZ
MGSFGDRLRREREQRGISLNDVALATKIRAGLLQALEEEKFERLPGGIFNKGFVRAYARHLGIDEEQAIADYMAASGDGPIRRIPEGARVEPEPRIQLVKEERAEKQGSLNPRGLLAGLAVLVVVFAAAWFYYHREREHEASSAPAAVSEPPTTKQPESAPLAATPTNGITPSDSSAQPGAPEKAPAQPKSGTTLPQAKPSEAPPATTAAALTPAGSFTVHLKADDECWMQIGADGKSEEVLLEGGGEKVITAQRVVLLKAGNVGALDISFNGKKLPVQGEYGQVKTMTFGPDGLEPPKPAATTAPSP